MRISRTVTRLAGAALIAICAGALAACGGGGLVVMPTVARLGPTSAVAQGRVRAVVVSASPELPAEHQEVLATYDVAGAVRQAVIQGLAESGTMDPAGLIEIRVVVTRFRLRSPMFTGVAMGPDTIEGRIEVVGPGGTLGYYDAAAQTLLIDPPRASRLSRLLTGFVEQIMRGLPSVVAAPPQLAAPPPAAPASPDDPFAAPVQPAAPPGP